MNEDFCGLLQFVNFSNQCCKHLTCDGSTAQFSEILMALEKINVIIPSSKLQKKLYVS